MRAVVLADTHMGPRSSRRLPGAVYNELARADVILHAGDVVTAHLLDELAGFAPVHAVLGNNDHDLVGALPTELELALAGVPVAMVHDSGATKGRERRLARRFPGARVVVFGHSHLPVATESSEGQLLFNPGSATWKRMARTPTIGLLDLDAGEVRAAEVLAV